MDDSLSYMIDSPAYECKGYQDMKEMWVLIEDLLGGTLAMRAAGRRWLPQEPEESWESYDVRLKRSVLYNGFGDTIEKLAARPFSKAITYKYEGKLPDPIKWMEEDADNQGQHIAVVSHELFKDGVAYGLAHCLVDYPVTEGTQTLLEEETNKRHPYIVRIEPDNLIFWNQDAKGNLVEIRYKEIRISKRGEFGQQSSDYIIRWTPQDVTEYVKVGAEYKQIGAVRPHKHGRIPLFTFYTERTDYLMANPPLEDLAWMNIAHWQSYSDQRNILRFARMGILFMSGVTPTEKETPIVIAANRVIKSTEKDAKLAYVEHSGKAIGAGADDIATIEEKMMVLGMQPLFESTGKATATGRAIDESRSSGLAQSWALEFQSFLESIYRYAAKIVQKPLNESFKVSIFNEFSLSLKAGLDVQALLAMRQANQISHETFLEEMKRRSVLADSLVIEDEIKLAKQQAKEKQDQEMASAQAQASARQKTNNNMKDPVTNAAGV